MAMDRNLQDTKKICDMRNSERAELCRILNKDSRWKELGYRMEMDPEEIKLLKKSLNPTGMLLTMWGENNHTIVELYALLQSMEHHQAMVHLQSSNKQKIGVRTFNQQRDLRGPESSEIVAYVRIEESPKKPRQSSKIRLGNATARKKKSSRLSRKTKRKLPEIPQEELAIATDQWSERNILGKGAFGTVYRGTWKNIGVAIKKASDSYGPDPQREYEIQMDQTLDEIERLTSCRHKNILTLYGFSFDGEPPCLVYEVMPEGSLSHRLRLKDGSRPLNWMERLKIAKGTARGLRYLHTFGKRPLIHGDIKSDNILLDRFREPKIGDFGLAREGPKIGSFRKLTHTFGTRPYMPDEFRCWKIFSTKTDIYSYGIVLLELATGLRSHEPCEGYRFLKDFVDSWININFHGQRDIKAGDDNHKVYTKLMLLGEWCSDRLAQNRPEMDWVFQTLNGKSEEIMS